ncbi:hypothetical protein Ciccas_013648 [Cichlidogyrus casuarinus]|uniref:Uncharacterized protein n=1 Tax=Cichlidogyrus casuarinus TaxID=1844966 RepID=A0ABD2PLA2_9PLAT
MLHTIVVLFLSSLLVSNIHCCFKDQKIAKCYESCLGFPLAETVDRACKGKFDDLFDNPNLDQNCKQYLPQIELCTPKCRPEFWAKVTCIRNCLGDQYEAVKLNCEGQWKKLMKHGSVSKRCEPYKEYFKRCDKGCENVGTYNLYGPAVQPVRNNHGPVF